MATVINLNGGRDRSGGITQKAASLRFNIQDDARNYAMQVVKRLHDWLIAQGMRTAAEDYLESQCEILLDVQFTRWREPRNFKLVMQVIPFIDNDLQRPCGLSRCPRVT